MRHGKWWAITSFLFLACSSFAQVPTPIRSVSSLPATCKGGSAAQPSDMVVLIVAGVGTNYLCTAPNVWTQVTGGAGSPPGGTVGMTQFNSGVGVFGGNIAEVNATAFAGADICAQINAAIAALPAEGGSVLVPGGNYSACAGSGGIGITINKKNIILRGVSSGSPLGFDNGATTINLAAGVTGIDITLGKISVRDLFLMSASSGAGSDDGIRVRGGSATLEHVTVKHFGNHGININGGNTGGSADLWHFEDVESTNNFGDGFHFTSPCTDNNLGTGIQLDAVSNVGWGYNVDCGGDNYFLTTHASGNTAGGYRVASSWNIFMNAYAEVGTGSSFVVVGGATVGVKAFFQAFGQPTTITNNGAAQNGNQFEYFGAEGWPEHTNFFLGDMPGRAGNTTYMFNVGGFAPGNFSLFDITNGKYMVNYGNALGWAFNQRVTMTPNATVTGLNIGVINGDPSSLLNGDMWYDTIANKFRCYENGAATNCIGAGGGGSVTHTAGALTLNKGVFGNGGGDIVVDANVTTDASGNVVFTSVQSSGANGGMAGVEGTGAGLTPGIGQDLLWPDSTGHCWKQSLNNVAKGCTLTTSDWTLYNHSGTVQASAHAVQDSCTLGTDCAVTLTGSAVYTNSTSYTCTCQDDSSAAACKVVQSSGSAFTVTGSGTDSIRYSCVGN